MSRKWNGFPQFGIGYRSRERHILDTNFTKVDLVRLRLPNRRISKIHIITKSKNNHLN